MRRPFLVASAFVGAIVILTLYRFPPERYAFYPGCLFHALTGWSCPGCGSTRALAAMLHGEVLRAITLNPLLPFFALTLYLVLYFREKLEHHGKLIAIGLGSSLVVLTLARNLLHF